VVAIPQIVNLGFEPNGNLRKFKVKGVKFKAQEANFKVDRGKNEGAWRLCVLGG
jgi:hypothetical protein